MPGLHFHDLRHTGNPLSAKTGASPRDLMARMDPDSSWAALIYQHMTTDANRAIADGLSDHVKAAETKVGLRLGDPAGNDRRVGAGVQAT